MEREIICAGVNAMRHTISCPSVLFNDSFKDTVRVFLFDVAYGCSDQFRSEQGSEKKRGVFVCVFVFVIWLRPFVFIFAFVIWLHAFVFSWLRALCALAFGSSWPRLFYMARSGP